jgi:hypothetical protein
LHCEADLAVYYINENVGVNCIIKNTGNSMLKDIEVCLDDCHNINLALNQEQTVNFEQSFDQEDEYSLKITAKNDLVTKTSYVPIKVLNPPNLEISQLKHPSEVQFNDKFDIYFLINKTAQANPYNVRVFLDKDGIQRDWDLDIKDNKEFVIHLMGKELSVDDNTFILQLDYQDKDRQTFHKVERFNIKLLKPTLGQRLLIMFRSFDEWLRKLFIT